VLVGRRSLSLDSLKKKGGGRLFCFGSLGSRPAKAVFNRPAESPI
jgi:hypothetical protein